LNSRGLFKRANHNAGGMALHL